VIRPAVVNRKVCGGNLTPPRRAHATRPRQCRSPPLHVHDPPRSRRGSHRVVRRPRRVRELDQRSQIKLNIHADRSGCHCFRANAFRPQLHSPALLLLAYFRRCVLAGSARRRRRSARFVLRCSKSPPPCAAVCAASGFIWRRIGEANRASPAVIVRSPARQCSDDERERCFKPGTVSTGRVLDRTTGGRFCDCQRASSLSDDIATNMFHIERVVTAGDGAVTDSFTNNRGS